MMNDPVLDLIVAVIKDSELDCCMWVETAQIVLAKEILEALEKEYYINDKFVPGLED